MSQVYSPRQVAAELGISESMLRRYSLAYESLYGLLPRDSRNGRVYTGDTLRLFLDVRNAVTHGEKVEDAFRSLNTELETVASPEHPVIANHEAIELLRSLHKRIESLENEIRALKSLPRSKSSLEHLQEWLRNILGRL